MTSKLIHIFSLLIFLLLQQSIIYINVHILYIMVDRYCREIRSVKDYIENSLEISGILLKLKEHDQKLSEIDTNESAISTNLGKIEDNESNISFNLTKIEDNEKNISFNLGKISTNENYISSNSKKN